MVDAQKNPIPYYNMTPWKMIYIYIYLKKWIGRLKFKGGKGLLSRFHVVQVMKEPDWIGENLRAEPGFETDVNKQTVTRGLRQESPTEKNRYLWRIQLSHSIQFNSYTSSPGSISHFTMPSLLSSNFFLTTHLHKHPHFSLNFSGFYPTSYHPPRTSISCSAHRFFIYPFHFLLFLIISILIVPILCSGWIVVPECWFHCKHTVLGLKHCDQFSDTLSDGILVLNSMFLSLWIWVLRIQNNFHFLCFFFFHLLIWVRHCYPYN